jgi:hypothetical protein
MKIPANIVCINLKSRKDKRKFMTKQAKRAKFPITFFKTTKHQRPARGCLESHLSIIKQNKTNGCSNVLILEDDAKFLMPLKNLPDVPEDWDMLYLGATIKQLSRYSDHWSKVVECWSTHAYIIRDTLYDKVITDLENYPHEIDKYYVEHIQPNYSCYILTDLMTEQSGSFSDIENKVVDYSGMSINSKPYSMVNHTIEDGNFVMKMDPESIEKLPCISIITITRNRRKFMPLLVYNYNNMDYPKDLVEWIIIDDGTEPIKDLLPKERNIKYVHMDSESGKPLSVGYKRNYALKHYSQGEYIVHMDDDDIYFKHSISSRVKALISNKKECIGITSLPCMDIVNKLGFIVGSEFSVLSEASMCYSKAFWDTRNYNESVKTGEAVLFLKDRHHEIVQIPYVFVMIALTHNDNLTGSLRVVNDNLDTRNAYKLLYNMNDEFTQTFTDSF